MKEMSAAGYAFDFKKKELKKLEQKLHPCDACTNRKGCINCESGELRETEKQPIRLSGTSFSGEDEEMLSQVIEDFVKLAGPRVCYHKDVDWLKSFKERVQSLPK